MSRTRKRLLIAFTATAFLLAAACAVKIARTPSRIPLPTPTPSARHIAPDYLYPDPSLTPGKADVLTAAELIQLYSCPPSIHKSSCTYSEAHRNVPSSEHKQVYEEYAVPAESRNGRAGEVDHFFPLCSGGSNDLSNLWYQPAVNVWNSQNFGFHEKDALESWVCRQVKAGKLDPQTAFTRITGDWVAYYLEVRPKIGKSKVD